MAYALGLTIISFLADVFLRNFPGNLNVGRFNLSLYLQGLGIAFIWWWFWISLGSYFRTFASQKLLSALIGFIWSFFVVSDFVHFRYLGQHITAQSLRLTWQDPAYMIGYWNSYGGWIPSLTICFFTYFIAKRLYYGMQSKKRSLGGIVIPLITMAIETGHLTRKAAEGSLSIEASLLLSHINALRINLGSGPRLHAGNRLPVKAHENPLLPKAVVLFVTESLSTYHSKWKEGGPEALPKLESWLSKHTTLNTQNAFSNASATDMAMPSLFSGLNPDRSHDDFHKMPFIWDLFHASGYKTAWFSSQRFSWGGFSSFFTTKGLGLIESAETMGGKLINDTGQDDLLTSREVAKWLQGVPPEESVFLVINFNAAHIPCQKYSDFLPSIPEGKNCDKAMSILDESFYLTLSAIEARYPDFLVAFTSDHGDLAENERRVPRIESYYDEIIKIPMSISVSNSFKEKFGTQFFNLKENFSSAQISNIDLYPTFVDLLDLGRLQENRLWMNELSGVSLFSEVPAERWLLALNTGAIRTWSHEGFALVKGPWRFIYSQGKKPELYNVNLDSKQSNNLWNDSNPLAPEIKKIISDSKELKRIVEGRE